MHCEGGLRKFCEVNFLVMLVMIVAPLAFHCDLENLTYTDYLY